MPARVSGSQPPSQPAKAAQQPFKALLEEARRSEKQAPTAKRAKPATNALALTAAAPAKTVVPDQRTVARARVDAEANRLQTVRAHHTVTAEHASSTRTEQLEQTETTGSARVVELIVKELVDAFETRPGGAAASKIANPVQPLTATHEVPFSLAQGAPPSQAQAPEVRAAQAVALIERIDTFVKSQRPALALTLNNSLGARVEIEKLGPGRIALRLVGQNGPPSAESVSRIREELRARGLHVGALSVA